MSKTFSSKTKHKLIQRYQTGESIKAISENTHIAQSILYSWVKLTHHRIQAYDFAPLTFIIAQHLVNFQFVIAGNAIR